MINSTATSINKNIYLPFSELEIKQQARALQSALKSQYQNNETPTSITTEVSKEILAKTLGFNEWNSLTDFSKENSDDSAYIECTKYISDFFIYLSENFNDLNCLDEQLFKKVETFSDDLLNCSELTKQLNTSLQQKILDDKIISNVELIVKSFYYCYISTKHAYRYKSYITSLYENEFYERLDQLKPDDGIEHLEIQYIQFLITHELHHRDSVLHLSLIKATRELLAGNNFHFILKKIISLLTMCMSEYNNLILKGEGANEPKLNNYLKYHQLKQVERKSNIFDLDAYDFTSEEKLKTSYNFSLISINEKNLLKKTDRLKTIINKMVLEKSDASLFGYQNCLNIISYIWGNKAGWQETKPLLLYKNNSNLVIRCIDYVLNYLEYIPHYIKYLESTTNEYIKSPMYFNKDKQIKSILDSTSRFRSIEINLKQNTPIQAIEIDSIYESVLIYAYYYIRSYAAKSYNEFIRNLWEYEDVTLLQNFEVNEGLQGKSIGQLLPFMANEQLSLNMQVLLHETSNLIKNKRNTEQVNKVICLIAFCMLNEKPPFEHDTSKRPTAPILHDDIKQQYFLCDWVN